MCSKINLHIFYTSLIDNLFDLKWNTPYSCAEKYSKFNFLTDYYGLLNSKCNSFAGIDEFSIPMIIFLQITAAMEFHIKKPPHLFFSGVVGFAVQYTSSNKIPDLKIHCHFLTSKWDLLILLFSWRNWFAKTTKKGFYIKSQIALIFADYSESQHFSSQLPRKVGYYNWLLTVFFLTFFSITWTLWKNGRELARSIQNCRFTWFLIYQKNHIAIIIHLNKIKFQLKAIKITLVTIWLRSLWRRSVAVEG